MKYTTISEHHRNEILRIRGGNVDKEEWRISDFSINAFNIIPFKYQHMLFKEFFKRDRIVVCKSRQIGISTAIMIMSLYSAVKNLFASGPFKNRKIGRISKANEQAKRVLLEIKRLMLLGDQNLAEKPFEDATDKSKFAPQNMLQISFANRSFIKCFPPTDAIRGEALDLVFVDEGAFVDDAVFYDAIEPTTSKTGGKIIIVSTPNGQKGYFFDMFDPFDKFKTHEYFRFWFYWKQCEDQTQRKRIKDKLYESREKGTLKNFDQEYNAMFTVDEEAFFENSDVNNGVDQSLSHVYEWKKTPCSLSIDYGQTRSKMCLTVKTKEDGIIKQLCQWAKLDFDENLLMDKSFEHSIPNLMERYHVQWVVVDDCSQGYRTNQQLENEGLPVMRIYFSAGKGSMGLKNKMYYSYRGALKKGFIKYPQNRELMSEMKALMEVVSTARTTTSIRKPKSGFDDRIDGEVMASWPFLEMEGDFEAVLIGEESDKKLDAFNAHRFDEEWERLQAELPDPRGTKW